MSRLLVCGLLAGLLPIAAFGQATPVRPESGDSAQAAPQADSMRFIELAPVVVTATRSVQELEDVAVPVSVVTADEIRARGALRLSDVLAEIPGLALFDDHGEGIQIQGLDPAYTLILIDGEPVIGRTAGTLSLDRLTVAGVARVEVVRGPSSSLYGSEALAGVVNLITQRPASQLAGGFRTRYGTHQSTDLTATVEGGGPRTGARLLVNRYSSGGYDLTPDVFGATAPRFADYTTDLRLHWTPGDRTTVRLGGRLAVQDQENTFSLVEEGAEVWHDQRDARTDWSLHPEISHRLSDRFRAEVSLYAARYTSETRMTRQSDGGLYYGDDFDQHYGKAELQLDAFWNARHLTMVGGGAVTEALGGDRYEVSDPSARSGFVFAQHTWLPSERLELNLSARFDAHSAYTSRLSPKASLMVRPLDGLRLRASVGSGFKAPDFRQLYLTFTNAAAGYSVFGATELAEGLARLQAAGQITEVFIDPAGLDPILAEHSFAYNAGVSADLGPAVTLSVGGFRNNLHDLIETQPVAQKTSGSFVYGYFNLDRVRTQGLEAEATLAPAHGLLQPLTLELGYQYLQARDLAVVDAIRDGSVFGRSPSGRDVRLTLSDYGGLFGRSKHMATVHATWRLAEQDLVLSLRGRWRSRYGYRDVDGNGLPNRDDEFVPAYAVWNATFTKGFAVPFADRLSLQLGVENLTDVTRPTLIPTMPGRTLFAGLGLDF